MFVNAYVKDYVIDLDGKPYTVKGERWLGVVNPDKPESYFEGQIFDYDEKAGRYTGGCTTLRTKAEYDELVKCSVFFK